MSEYIGNSQIIEDLNHASRLIQLATAQAIALEREPGANPLPIPLVQFDADGSHPWWIDHNDPDSGAKIISLNPNCVFPEKSKNWGKNILLGMCIDSSRVAKNWD